MKHCLNIHQDYQPPKPSLCPLYEISCEWPTFHKFYVQSTTKKPC